MSYCVPAFFFVVMVAVITIGLRENYAIEVSLDGESIGYVNNYTTITNADSVIKNKLVTLEEKDIAPLTIDKDGFVEFEITGKKILTIKFN